MLKSIISIGTVFSTKLTRSVSSFENSSLLQLNRCHNSIREYRIGLTNGTECTSFIAFIVEKVWLGNARRADNSESCGSSNSVLTDLVIFAGQFRLILYSSPEISTKHVPPSFMFQGPFRLSVPHSLVLRCRTEEVMTKGTMPSAEISARNEVIVLEK
jgi:hypothetical protein